MATRAMLSRALMAGADPATTVTSVAAGVSAGQSYTSPTAGERADAATGLARLASGDTAGAETLLTPLGFTVTTDYDPATGRRYAMAVSETATARAWGLYLIDLTAPSALCVAVPHPKSDLHCEQLALRLWRATPGGILAMAAVHRDAASGTADHSQNTTSVFHIWWTTILGPRGVPMVQIHGFADATATEQVVVSTGSTTVFHPAATRVADEIASTGLVTTRSWDGTGDTDLLATTNAQAIAAETGGWVWLHIEHNNTVRTTPALWQKAIDAAAAADIASLARDRPSPGGTGHFAKAVGGSNTTGTSMFFAREDHIHRGATTTHATTHATGGSDLLTPAAIGAQPVDTDLTTIAGLTATTDNFMQAKAGAWASRTVAQVKTDLAISNINNTADSAKPVSTAQQVAIDGRAQIVARGYRATNSPAATVTGTPVGVLRLDDIPLPVGYTYLIYTGNLRLTCGANDSVEVALRLTFDGATPSVSTTAFATASTKIPDAGIYEALSLLTSRTPAGAETLSVLLTVARIAGSAGNASIGGNAAYPIELFVESKGTAVTNTGINL